MLRAIAGEARWELTGPKGVEHVDIPARLVGDHGQLVLDATLAGLGIALLPTFLAEPHVATGALAPCCRSTPPRAPLHVLTHASRHLPRRVALLRDFLADGLTSSCKAPRRAQVTCATRRSKPRSSPRPTIRARIASTPTGCRIRAIRAAS